MSPKQYLCSRLRPKVRFARFSRRAVRISTWLTSLSMWDWGKPFFLSAGGKWRRNDAMPSRPRTAIVWSEPNSRKAEAAEQSHVPRALWKALLADP